MLRMGMSLTYLRRFLIVVPIFFLCLLKKLFRQTPFFRIAL